jgi:hypothetical protein
VARITFQKRQKEMKRLEKQRAKAERRAERKLTKGTEPQMQDQDLDLEGLGFEVNPPTEAEPHS